MISHFSKAFFGNRHSEVMFKTCVAMKCMDDDDDSGCQLFLAQTIRPITASYRGFPE